MTANEVYKLVDVAIQRSREQGDVEVANQLEAALKLGSSGLEILGAIRAVLKANAPRLQASMGGVTVNAIVDAIDQAYGTKP